jgi:hypothetical protein
MCSETPGEGKPRRSPNANVMFEYGYAISKPKGRDRIICLMNTFYGGADPSELPFDLRHARAPIRYSLSPDSSPDEKNKVRTKLRAELLSAAKLIVQNLPSPTVKLARVTFDKPTFAEGQEITPEGDFSGQNNPTFFDSCTGFVYLKGRPLDLIELSIVQVKNMENPTAGLSISRGSRGGSFGSNKWGRISYALYVIESKRLSSDYVQYFRTGEIEMVNGSYLTAVKRGGVDIVHVGYLTTQIVAPMLAIAKQWLENAGILNFIVEIGIIGIEGWRITLDNIHRGPMIHVNRISTHKKVDKDSILLLAQEFQSTLLAEAGIS